MTNLPPDRLAQLIRASQKGLYGTEAAAELLIAHHRWLHEPSFLDACAWITEDPDIAGPEPWASIDWSNVRGYLEHTDTPYSTSEGQILALCAELAGHDSGQPLGHLLTGLDERNSQLVLDAIAHVLRRGGW